jgi:23S rRNA (uracil1939-C5)-methyltransferase
MNNTAKVVIESIDAQGQAVARIDGKTIFVNDLLPGEEAIIEIYKNKTNFSLAKLVELVKSSPDRIEPKCPNFGICGGCSLQHMSFEAQIASKQKVLIDNLKHIGKVIPINILDPIKGTAWGYRHKARLSVKYVVKKDSVLVGFLEKNVPYITNMSQCEILPQHISALIMPLRELIIQLSIKTKIPQIELAVGDNLSVLVFRIIENLTAKDEILIRDFVHNHNKVSSPLQIWLQPKGTDSCYPLMPEHNNQLSYALPEFNIVMPYMPTEFTQVNPVINQQMVSLAIKLLNLSAEDEVFDFFCGIGNFTLPIASKVKNVIGIEGSEQLVTRARENAVYNQLSHKTSYVVANLFDIDNVWLQKLGKRKKWLIDPPRNGAIELVQAITTAIAPDVIVYVSCNTATLARDAAILVHNHGYKLQQTGILNMFAQTAHVESIALFTKDSCI